MIPAVALRLIYLFNKHRPHRTLGQAAPLRPLPERTRTEIDVRRRDRLGGLLHEYQQVACRAPSFGHPHPQTLRSTAARGADGSSTGHR
jgi:hypothetical protein